MTTLAERLDGLLADVRAKKIPPAISVGVRDEAESTAAHAHLRGRKGREALEIEIDPAHAWHAPLSEARK